jgi:SAM-dependent methyltransferase
VVALAQAGMVVTGLDYTPAAVAEAEGHLRQALTVAPGLAPAQARIEQANVLMHQPNQPYDAVHEQTCLCALHPDHWTAYAAQLHRWLRPGGTLHALFMQAPRAAALQEGRIEGPPYHCDINAMRALFPDALWVWPAPPYASEPHPNGMHELLVPLVKR